MACVPCSLGCPLWSSRSTLSGGPPCMARALPQVPSYGFTGFHKQCLCPLLGIYFGSAMESTSGPGAYYIQNRGSQQSRPPGRSHTLPHTPRSWVTQVALLSSLLFSHGLSGSLPPWGKAPPSTSVQCFKYL